MKVPYSNETSGFVHIGPVTIAPGATRDVEQSHIPGYKPAEEAPAPPVDDPLAVLLSHSIPTVIAGLDGLSRDQLEKLGELEQKGQARKGVLGPIAEILLKAAAPDSTNNTLLGSSNLPAVIELAEGKEIQLGDLVAATQLKSGLAVAEWNALDDAKRDELLSAEIELMKKSAEKAE